MRTEGKVRHEILNISASLVLETPCSFVWVPAYAWCASVMQREGSDVSDGEEEDYCTPDGTEDIGDNEVSEVGCTDEERQGKGEVGICLGA